MVSDIKGAASTVTQALTQGLNKTDKSVAGSAQGANNGAPASSGEVVTVTDLGLRLQRLSASVENLPVVDQDRVNSLRESIANGSYQIDDQQIADKLTALEQQLGAADPS